MRTRSVSRRIASDWAVRETFRFVSFIALRGIGLRKALSRSRPTAPAPITPANRSPVSPCSRATVAPPEGEVKRPARPMPLGGAQKKGAIR
jgi:hypothetical protein